MCLIPGPGRSHRPWSNWAWAPQLLSPRAATAEACALRTYVPQQEKPPQWEARTPQQESRPHSPQEAHAAIKTQHSQNQVIFFFNYTRKTSLSSETWVGRFHQQRGTVFTTNYKFNSQGDGHNNPITCRQAFQHSNNKILSTHTAKSWLQQPGPKRWLYNTIPQFSGCCSVCWFV